MADRSGLLMAVSIMEVSLIQRPIIERFHCIIEGNFWGIQIPVDSNQGRSQGEAQGAIAPPFFPRVIIIIIFLLYKYNIPAPSCSVAESRMITERLTIKLFLSTYASIKWSSLTSSKFKGEYSGVCDLISGYGFWSKILCTQSCPLFSKILATPQWLTISDCTLVT